MAFYVGQKVVCVNDDWSMKLTKWERFKAMFRRPDTDPVQGSVYTIREIVSHEARSWLRFYECENRPEMGFGEPAYLITSFRPVVERKTDISELTAILNGKRIQLPDLVEEPARSSLADRFVGTLGVLAGGWLICTAISFAQFLEMQ